MRSRSVEIEIKATFKGRTVNGVYHQVFKGYTVGFDYNLALEYGQRLFRIPYRIAIRDSDRGFGGDWAYKSVEDFEDDWDIPKTQSIMLKLML